MARLLGGSLFAGQVGKDTSGEHILSEMRDAGVNLKFVKINLILFDVGQAFILLNDKGENSIIIVGGANMKYPKDLVLPQEYKEAIDSCKFSKYYVK